MQVQLNLLFDPSEQGELVNRLEKIILLAAGNSGITVPASGTRSPSDTPGAPPYVTKAEQDAEALKVQRQAQAATARAAKAAKQSQAAQAAGSRVSGGIAQTPVDDLSGTNGQDQSDDEDMGLDPPTSMSPGEARDAALALVREVYSAGHVAEVKALQKALNVAKFYDVPVTDGHSLYARVMKLAQSTGLRQ